MSDATGSSPKTLRKYGKSARTPRRILAVLFLVVVGLVALRAHHVVNLVAAYGFLEGTGAVANDASGERNTATLFNGASWSTGMYGTGLTLDGVDDFAAIADASSLDLGSTGTVEAWVRLDTVNRWNAVIAKGSTNNDAAHNYAIEIDQGNRVHCLIGNGTALNIATSTTRLSAQQFYHLACTWDSLQLRLYINGALNRSVAQTLTPAANTSPLFVGQYGGSVDRLDGVIDEVRIYNIALPAADVVTDMNAPVEVTADTAPPSVSVVNPPDGSNVAGRITVVASATDD